MDRKVVVFCAVLVAIAAQYESGLYVPQYLKNKYGSQFGGHAAGGVKTKTKTKYVEDSFGANSYATLAAPLSNPGNKYRGGCAAPPPAPANAGIMCSQYSGCRAECVPNYQFPNRLSQLFIKCQNGQWQIEGNDFTAIPACQPVCLPPCQNNGICLAPNQCNCPENFAGPQCQFENKPCLNYPPMPVNARRTCRSKQCTITCMPGHKFPDDSAIASMICKDGFWVPEKAKWATIPDCRATCDPPCLNGGHCLSLNVCQCPTEFRGPQCQYNIDVCSAKRLPFNGGYNCSSDSESFSCALNCPEGINFEFRPAPVYVCAYNNGIFQPSPIPQCVFGENLNVIRLGETTNQFYHMPNISGFDLSSLSVNGLRENPFFNTKTHRYDTSPDHGVTHNGKIEYIPLGQYGMQQKGYVTVEEKLPESGICFTWAGAHYKTFDGRVFSFNSKCAHTLVSDALDNTFSVVVQNSEGCPINPETCYRIVKIYLQDREYILKRSDDGKPILTSPPKILPIPGRFPGVRAEMSAHYIVISLDIVGAKIKWDGQQLVQVEVKESLWNRTEGLCGRIDGDIATDFTGKNGRPSKSVANLATSWKVENLDDGCDDVPKEEHACRGSGIKQDREQKAVTFCKKLLANARFAPCHKVMDVSTLVDACQWDYCSCEKDDPTECACETMNVYVRGCSYKGIKNLATWRDDNTCPMKCTNGRIYKACGPPKGQASCGAPSEEFEDEGTCVEGCYCPEGTVLHENKCITRAECPCRLRGKYFQPGASVPKDCNTCMCSGGEWVCTQVSCGARCSAIGDPHYVTFDGKRYDFMGQCTYYLVKSDNFSIEAENVACAGAVSQAMNFPASVSDGLPSCTKTVTIRFNGQTIKLKQNHYVVVNGYDITKIPYKIAGINIRSVSSIFLKVDLPNGVEVWWDGITRAYIDIPALFQQRTKGLCGTFNYNQKDDFLTPEDDIEQAVVPFANKWKTSERCNDIPDVLKSHPCTINIQNKPTAENHCKLIKSDLFADCHWLVDPEPFYQDCMYDMCSCELKISKCLCPTIAAYAEECSRKGAKVDWRNNVRECGVHCAGGQTYQICGNSCTRMCSDIANAPDCKRQCAEGCNCPDGEALDDDDGTCIPIGKCKCQHDGMEFHPGYKEVRPATKGLELCTCLNALWNCQPASDQDVKNYPKASDLKSLCGHSENMEFTTCEPVEPITCKNMHSANYYSASICHPGCTCKEGFVLDSSTKKCVKPTECPCHHGGKSYGENATIQSACNTCTCHNGKWNSTNRPCAAECNAWGDSHFKTFDGKHYDYQGQCDYVLSKGSLGATSFDITIQNVPCGSLGTSCSKSVSARIKSGGEHEVISLTRDKPLPTYATMKHLTVRQKGLYVIVEAPDLGVTLHWDRGTRVYVKVNPQWKGKLKGLCGNYNGNEEDDFQTTSGGFTEATAKLFGDSWKLQPYCPEAQEITNTCEDKLERKMWALKQCGILKSSTFAPCHSEVPIDTYYEKCVFDACACDQGGDCECLCTALAAYAQECNNHGVPIKWRSQKLCPMQCDARCATYSPCISTCPSETCDNVLIKEKLAKTCNEDACIEGCAPKPCPPDQIYRNSSFTECVPRNVCRPFCLEIDGVQYYEGDLMESDDCHSCYCSREQKICKGVPCSDVATPLPVTEQMEQIAKCQSGWSEWINQDRAVFAKTKSLGGKKTDIEPLPSILLMNKLNDTSGGKCGKQNMVDIECRTVKTHWSAKKTGLDVECSLERGLICKSNTKGKKACPDFEIRIKCECEKPPPLVTPSPSSCDLNRPHQEHPTDCHLFYHCEPGTNGPKLVEKSCGPNMMYNPVSMVCDWPNSVTEIKPECSTGTSEPPFDGNALVTPAVLCPPGMVMDECAIQCDEMCMYYNYILRESGRCQNDVKCESGCVSAEKKLSCPAGKKWANNHTCIAMHDCLCRSHDGKQIKPGVPYKESDCEVCQCIDNFYACDRSNCELTTSVVEVFEEKTMPLESEINAFTDVEVFPTSTVTPPKKCDEKNFMDLIQGDAPLMDDAFSASSVLSPNFKAIYSKINSKVTEKSGGSWAPEYSNIEQYLQIDLGRQEPIYGITVKGSPLYDEYVTSFKVLYSGDGRTFQPLLNKENHPQIFRGSIDATSPVTQVFDTPFEAKAVRVNPQTWHNGISLRVELIGCGEELKTTTAEFEFVSPTPNPIECTDAMGLDSGMMADQQVSVSSELLPRHLKRNLRISGSDVWQPLTNSPTEYVQFDFLEARNITGFASKGGPLGWVTVFVVEYSHNDKDWNQIVDHKTMKEREFLGNFDSDSQHLNRFPLPLCARYIKVIPRKWHDNIQLRLEMLGCFVPYPEIEEIVTLPPPSPCNHCPGVPVNLELGACNCSPDTWWNGQNCANRTECPCIIGHIPYAIGSVFEKEDCTQCICKIGGVPHCAPKKCAPCENGLRRIVTTTCQCSCQPCPVGTVLCPTSSICINSTLWCNGVQDCSDDETGCTTPPPPLTTVAAEKLEKVCPVTTCPPGYQINQKTITKVQKYHSYLSPMFSSYGKKAAKHFSGGYAGLKTGGGVKRRPLQRPIKDEAIEEKICPEYRCISNKPPPKFIHNQKECPPINCPLDYVPLYDDDIEEINSLSKECPKYSCNPPPLPDAICNVTGRTFNTFDDTEYKYDICRHILARDLESDEWDVSLKRDCAATCANSLIIRHQDNLLVFHTDLTVEFDGYKYTADQTKQIGYQSRAFLISRVGNTLLFASHRYGFWIIWDKQGNIKLGVVRKLLNKVDGLCGYFNGNPDDDKRKPNGAPARTTVEFGDSWAQSDRPGLCEIRTCPLDVQNQAWEMCNKVKDQVLAPCARVLDIEAFVSRCIETACTCLQASGKNHTAEEECRCQTLQAFVVDCLSADPNTDLSVWRMQMDCPIACDAPLVYHDCYQRKCEPTCESLSDPNICPKLPNVCFPGCYCPPGFVRKKDTCIKPSGCRDCECNVLPHLQYITYDEANFTINGNCVYVMSRDKLMDDDRHKFQVLITNAPCKTNQEKRCVGKVTILYENHKIHIVNDFLRDTLKLIVDGDRIDDVDQVSKWMVVKQTPAKHLKLILTDVMVEVSVYYPSLGVSVKAPSHKYEGKLEGLCGDCNENPADDIRTSSGALIDNINDFGLSWLYDNLPGGQSKEMCENKPQDDCPPLPVDSDPCIQLLDLSKFGQCIKILDPTLFVEWCKKDTCGGHPEMACTAIEAYARDCASAGFCINWRNEYCPHKTCTDDKVYHPCGTNCPKTCQSIKEKQQACYHVPVEGCFCPDDKVLLNGTCVIEEHCEVCDDEGHHPGDKWQKDKCTSCMCEGTSLKCETKHCSEGDKICEKGYHAVKLPTNEEECCDKYACMLEPTVGPTCETPQKLLCGDGQILKLDTKPNGCQQFICACKPPDDCDPQDMSTETPLEDGYVKLLDSSGCCPKIVSICKPELCKKPEPCQQYHNLKNTTITDKCCPLYTCEPPKDKCIYENEFVPGEKGGERPRTAFEKQKVLKDADEIWKDGPCLECKCLMSEIGNYQSSCVRSECPPIETSQDYLEYTLEPDLVYDQCCPNVKRIACKFDDKVYKVGEKWHKDRDYCITYECADTPNGIQKETRVSRCDTNCDLGFEYVPPTVDSKECCGSCKSVACVVDGVVHKIGDEWHSPDRCTNYFCLNINGSIQVQSVLVNCPELPKDYIENFIIETVPNEGKCCKTHKTIACKVGDEIYEEAESWPSPDGDKCKTFTCVKDATGSLIKQESIETCKTNCMKGWEYKESAKTCCGQCEQVACVVDDALKTAGEKWTSPDNCTYHSCEQLGDQLTVITQQESCPPVDKCPKEHIYVKGCCKHCNITSMPQGKCTPEPIVSNKTVGIIKTFRPSHGACVNTGPIDGFTECVGNCHSSTFFNLKSGIHESICTCCQAIKYDSLEIEMKCEDGHVWMKKVAIPSQCGCEGCAAQKSKPPTKSFVKTG